MPVDTCKREIEVTVPVEDIDTETERVVTKIQKKIKLPGFRPGKAPANLIRTKYQSEVRQDVLESLVPKYFQKRVDADGLRVVGRPNVTEVHFEKGEPLRFKAEFEIAPEIELGEYRGVTIPYHEPQVSDEDVNQRAEQLREQKAQYINIDPRPVENGDYAVVSLDSLAGVDSPVHQEEMTLHVGDSETMPAFTEALLGMSPEEEKEFDVTYPDDYGQEKLAGKTVRFRMKLKTIRRKELPELNDDFAQDLGDFKTLDELREALRKTIFREREFGAQQEAKKKIIDRLIESHDFPVPEAFLDRQIETQVEGQLRELAGQGVDPRKLKIDWAKVKESHRETAIRDVRASLLLGRIAEREAIAATNDEVDREVQRFAKQEREPAAVIRKKLQENGALDRIAHQIQTEKTLSFLFEHARKEAGENVEPVEPAQE